MEASYVIPSSHPTHWRAALDRTAEWASLCKPQHPLPYWRQRVEALLAGAPTPENVSDFVERFLVPTAYLCRLAHSLSNLAPMGAAYEKEVGQALNDPGSFIPFEHILHLASRITHAGHEVEFVGRRAHKAPDLVVPAQRVAIEARARGPRAPRRCLRDDFEHAEAKFAAELVGADGVGWTGILALDLGVCGTPSLPDVGRLGPALADLTLELDGQLATARTVAGAVIGWVGAAMRRDGPTASVRPASYSGWRMRNRASAPPCIADAFHSWERQSLEVARRTGPDCDADLRRRLAE